MTISLNGTCVEVGAENIAQLVECYQLPSQSVLVEHNGLALQRREWPQQLLAPGDRVEFIRIVAGG